MDVGDLSVSWVQDSIKKILAEMQRSSDTHLFQVPMPDDFSDIQVYIKDESTHPTGSLKHRLARSLFLYSLANGDVAEGTTIIEASSGSTAVSEAYFARLLGLPFVAVMPDTTSRQKQAQIEFYGGRCHLVKGSEIYNESARLAKELNGHYMDQFTNAERATDWRGNNNIADSIFKQMRCEPNPEPKWIVVSAGTGGTSATIGRYINYKGVATRLCVPDPEHSVFYDYYQTRDSETRCDRASAIEGIGRPRVEPSFIAAVVDRMIKVPDAASFAAMQHLSDLLGLRVGGSTGTNLFATYQLAAEMKARGETGSIVTMLCDRGERYIDTYYNEEWLQQRGYTEAMQEFSGQLQEFYRSGRWTFGQA